MTDLAFDKNPLFHDGLGPVFAVVGKVGHTYHVFKSSREFGRVILAPYAEFDTHDEAISLARKINGDDNE